MIVTSEDRTKEYPAGFLFLNEAMKQHVLMVANVENDNYSWVAAEVQVSYQC